MEFEGYLRFVMALVFVLALIGGCAALARRFGIAQPLRTGSSRRLAVTESITLDPKRRLVLVKRDSVEHLVILGAGTELLIESGIEGGEAPTPPQAGTGDGEESP